MGEEYAGMIDETMLCERGGTLPNVYSEEFFFFCSDFAVFFMSMGIFLPDLPGPVFL